MPLPQLPINGCRRRMRQAFIISALLLLLTGSPLSGAAMQEDGAERTMASVQVVHGVSDAGPIDVYVDGALALIGIVFLETSAELLLSEGEHAIAVVPTGSGPDAAIVSGTIAIAPGARLYATLLGVSDDAAVGLFSIDGRRLDASRARFRVVSGIYDAGEIVPAFTGGDAISPPLGFGDASEYAAIEAGSYDIDILDAASGALLLSLPQTLFAEGTTNDIFLVGQLADATVQPIIETVEAGTVQVAGRVTQIVSGTCAAPGDAVADVGLVRPGQGEPIGAANALPVENGFGLATVSFAALVESPHAVTVARGEQANRIYACADIGGRLTDTGALVVALRAERSGTPAGVAVLAPGLDDPNATGVSVFLVTDSNLPANEDAVGTPVPE